jgi:hypothetical protein
MIFLSTFEAKHISTGTCYTPHNCTLYLNSIFTTGSWTPPECAAGVSIAYGKFFVVYTHFRFFYVLQVKTFRDHDLTPRIWTTPKETVLRTVDVERDVVFKTIFTQEVIATEMVET